MKNHPSPSARAGHASPGTPSLCGPARLGAQAYRSKDTPKPSEAWKRGEEFPLGCVYTLQAQL